MTLEESAHDRAPSAYLGYSGLLRFRSSPSQPARHCAAAYPYSARISTPFQPPAHKLNGVRKPPTRHRAFAQQRTRQPLRSKGEGGARERHDSRSQTSVVQFDQGVAENDELVRQSQLRSERSVEDVERAFCLGQSGQRGVGTRRIAVTIRVGTVLRGQTCGAAGAKKRLVSDCRPARIKNALADQIKCSGEPPFEDDRVNSSGV